MRVLLSCLLSVFVTGCAMPDWADHFRPRPNPVPVDPVPEPPSPEPPTPAPVEPGPEQGHAWPKAAGILWKPKADGGGPLVLLLRLSQWPEVFDIRLRYAGTEEGPRAIGFWQGSHRMARYSQWGEEYTASGPCDVLIKQHGPAGEVWTTVTVPAGEGGKRHGDK